jgi:hypothetical protein
MTRKTKLYTNPSNNNLRIPTREEFHRYASNLLSDSDFCTNSSSGYQINRVAKAIDWTKKKTKAAKKGVN